MLKIAITGPESTGKSALCEALAKHYNTLWVPEFARIYLDEKTTPYNLLDLDIIANGQINIEQEAEKKANKILFCDTEMTVMKIWCEYAYKECTPIIEMLYKNQHYDLYLLMDIDLNWEPDPLREHPHLRQYFFDCYRSELESSKRNFKIIWGTGNLRLENAIKAIDDFIEAE